MQVDKRSRLQYRIQHILFIVLLLAVVGMLAWLSTQYTLRSDWTYNSRNSLSAATIELLNSIEGAVQIRSYQDQDPMRVQAVIDILQRYKNSKPDIQFRILNPDLDVELAKADNITLYGQTVIEYQGHRETIDTLSEQQISNALIRISRKQQPVLLFSSGHGERDPRNTSNIGYSNLLHKLDEKGFQLRSINLLSQSLNNPDDILIIAGPDHDFSPGETEKIVSFVKTGGRLLWLQDPGGLQGLQPLADALGITFVDGVVVDNNPTLRQTLRIQHPAVVPVVSYPEHKINEDMRYNTLFSIATALQFKPHDNWQISSLLKTLPGSWSETDGFVLDVQFDADKGDTRGPLDLGLALEREQDGRQQRAAVIGDSDFLSNTYVGAGANLIFAMNALNWLTEDEQLIAIEPRNAPDLKLEFNDIQVFVTGFGVLLVLPVALLASGLVIWYRRRNR